MVVMQAAILLFGKGVAFEQVTINIIVLIVSIIVFQLIIGHIWHDIGLSYLRSILLMMLPFGLGVFIQQVCITNDNILNGKCLKT
ncbi:Putative membrane spanning protein [Staphylococcus aureus]|uniref:Membrane spanning protein n=1 Tax=Staphylococcus aureus TaxID=1280 RepID=A0A380EEM3_STAAU|nr:Putative membrane spanning protein [Staphylococcus aureus]